MDAIYSQHKKYLTQCLPIDWKNYAIILHCINLNNNLKLVDGNLMISDLSQVAWNLGTKCQFNYMDQNNRHYQFTYTNENAKINWKFTVNHITRNNSIFIEELAKLDFNSINWSNGGLEYYIIMVHKDINEAQITVPFVLDELPHPQLFNSNPIARGLYLGQSNPFESGNLMGPNNFVQPSMPLFGNGIRFDPPFMMGYPDNDEFYPPGTNIHSKFPGPFNGGFGGFN